MVNVVIAYHGFNFSVKVATEAIEFSYIYCVLITLHTYMAGFDISNGTVASYV